MIAPSAKNNAPYCENSECLCPRARSPSVTKNGTIPAANEISLFSSFFK